MWDFQGYYKERWWHLSGFWATIFSFKTEEDANKFARQYNEDPSGGFEVKTRLVCMVNKTVQKEIKLRYKKYESQEEMVKRIWSP
jgi:hypothetical protein